MANKITLDFENEMIIWDMDSQYGSELCPGLAEKESAILALLGYEMIDFSSEVNLLNALFNGNINEAEFLEKMKELENEEE